MDVTELTLSPSAVALNTRDRDEDYSWRVEVGQFFVGDLLKKMYREMIADKSAEPATSLIFLYRNEVLGLLVANLKSHRQDHSQTLIDDTLLMEFPPDQLKNLLRIVASLVDPSTAYCRTTFLEYAEKIFQPESGRLSAFTFRIPVPSGEIKEGLPVPSGEIKEGLPDERCFAFRSNDTNLKRVASFLRSAAATSDASAILKCPFLLVSTGFVGPEVLARFAATNEQFVALSRSSSLPDTGIFPLKKKMFRSRRTFVYSSFSATIIGICLVSFLFYCLISLNSSDQLLSTNTELPYSKINDSDSLKIWRGDYGRNYGLNQAGKVGSVLGLASSGDRLATLAAISLIISDTWAGKKFRPDSLEK